MSPSSLESSLERSSPTGESITLPVIEESIVVERRTVETGRVRIEKSVNTELVHVDEPTIHEEVRVERVAIDREVDAAAPPLPRTEGDTTVIPILEEVLVVEKRLVLREELRVTRVRREERSPQEVALRREHVTVERS